MIEGWINRFVVESNRIEGIDRLDYTLHMELQRFEDFMKTDCPSMADVCQAAMLFTGGEGLLRSRPGMDVRIGGRTPEPGGPKVVAQLDKLIHDMFMGKLDPFEFHKAFEELHPFMDGNGRTGRLLWAWMMLRKEPSDFAPWKRIGFLHTWYYQSLS